MINIQTELLFSEIHRFCKSVTDLQRNNPISASPGSQVSKIPFHELSDIHITTLSFENFFSDIDTSNTLSETDEHLIYSTMDLGLEIWNEDRDNILTDLIVKYKRDWKRILKRYKSITKCFSITIYGLKQRAKILEVDTTTSKKLFSKAEDRKLIEKVNECGCNWAVLVKEFPNRSWTSLKNRFYYLGRKEKKIAILE